MNDNLRPMCFVAMPFGRKAPAGKKKPKINFDKVYNTIERAVTAEGLECVRADFEASGGFIHRPMYERLLVAEYVIADVTLANPNVTYEIGVRHGASARATLLVGALGHLDGLPFDLRPFRVLSYALSDKGSLGKKAADNFVTALRERLADARQGRLPVDNPIMQVTDWNPVEGVQHNKTDVFMGRMASVGEIGQRIRRAVAEGDADKAIGKLVEIEDEILSNREVVSQLHTALLGVYLGYREKKAYQRMDALYDRLPGELQQTAVAREQLALALNRLAEVEHAAGRYADATTLRRRAENLLDEIAAAAVTSETYGIRGRIYKGWYDTALEAGAQDEAMAKLGEAIRNYEQGMIADMRDSYPGVNAVTLRLARGDPDDIQRLRAIVPVVRFASEAAPPASDPQERYWQTATRLELAGADRDWPDADRRATELLALEAEDWMRETTIKNLNIQKRAFRDDTEAVDNLQSIITRLQPA